MSAFVPLLGAKLLPPDPGTFHLNRPRLNDRLRLGLERRATVVLAGPGYGKTSLAARFLREWEGESVWLSLDASDRDLWLVFRYLIRGLREHAPEFAARTEEVWQDRRSRPEDVESLCDLFMSDAEESLGEKFLLVLDDVHHLEVGAGARMLRRLLAYLPGTLHLILLGRSLPEVGVKTLASEGTVEVIPGEDLLFTPQETRELLHGTFGLPLPAATVEKVHARTRGWPTALQLLRQTARLQQPSPDLPDELFVRTEAEIFDYFSEEVLSAESPEARELLLASCLPPVLDPDLLAEILPGLAVREILTSLVHRKLFVSPLESGGELYAYDPLFRDFLRRKLRAEKGADGQKELHVRYGEAFKKRGEWAQALEHFREAEQPRRIAEVLRRHGEALVRSGLLDAVKQAARYLESRGVRSAVAEALLGESLRLTGDYAAAVGHFDRALAGSERASRLPGLLRPAARQGLSYALLKIGQRPRAAEQAKQALAECDAGHPALQARILNTLAIIDYREERHAEAVAGWQEALGKAREAEDERLIRMIAHNLGLPHAVSGDFTRASECFRILTGAGGGSLGPEEGAAYLNLARIEALRGEYESAGRLLDDAREIAHRLRLASLSADVLEAEGTLRRETGDLEGAREKYAQARARFTELGLSDVLESLAEEEAILAARRGELQEAEAQAAALAEARRQAGDREGLASSLLALGEVRVLSGRNPRALESLAESARIFRDLGRAYQECVAQVHLALAAHRAGKAERARTAALRALRLSTRYGYAAAVGRAAALDGEFGRWLGGLPAAPEGISTTRRRRAPVAPVVATETSDLTVRLLGPIEVYRDASNKIPARAWKLRRALEIFCYLAASRERRATKDKIVDALWGDARLSVIEKNFHPTISFLRGALNHGHHVPKNFILFERGAYFLNPAHQYDIDAERFESGIRSARARVREGKAPAALGDYEAALALYRGPFLEEEYGAWTEAPRARFETLYLAALGEAAWLQREAGDLETSLATQRRRLEQDPLSEEASVDLMRTLALAGDRSGVEKEFERLSRALEEEVGSEPLPETRRAYEAARAASQASGQSPATAPGQRRPPRPLTSGRR